MLKLDNNGQSFIYVAALSSLDESCIPMHTSKAVDSNPSSPIRSSPIRSSPIRGFQIRRFQSVPECDLRGYGIDKAFWFLQVMRRSLQIAKSAEDSILIGVSRVSS
jgi:hypothetical protein